jgi:type VI protein secretion system component Hcp
MSNHTENKAKTTKKTKAAIDTSKTKDELSEQELDETSGGISLNYGEIKWTYTPQKT